MITLCSAERGGGELCYATSRRPFLPPRERVLGFLASPLCVGWSGSLAHPPSIDAFFPLPPSFASACKHFQTGHLYRGKVRVMQECTPPPPPPMSFFYTVSAMALKQPYTDTHPNTVAAAVKVITQSVRSTPASTCKA